MSNMSALPTLYPLVFEGENVSQIWGGTFLGSPIAGVPIGERWLLSSLPSRSTVIQNGALRGQRLCDIVPLYASDLLGENVAPSSIPLVKCLDTALPLSVQVHPDDSFAQQHGEPNGKEEFWYILDVANDSKLYIGLQTALKPSELQQIVQQGQILEYLNTYYPQPHQVYTILGGTIHAIDRGLRLLEFQQPSTTTYRLYDWDRVGVDGKKRELHIELATQASHLTPNHSCCTNLPLGTPEEKLAISTHFRLTRYILPKGEKLDLPPYHTLRVYISITDAFSINTPSTQTPVAPMQAVLLPAQQPLYTIQASTTNETILLEFAPI